MVGANKTSLLNELPVKTVTRYSIEIIYKYYEVGWYHDNSSL